jgi:hypothetical protein
VEEYWNQLVLTASIWDKSVSFTTCNIQRASEERRYDKEKYNSIRAASSPFAGWLWTGEIQVW